MATQLFVLFLGRLFFASHVIMPKCDNDTCVVLRDSNKARNEAMASLLESYDDVAADEAIESHMVHIPGVINKTSDILSREGESDLFYSTVALDFPSVRRFQDLSDQLPASIRSLSKLI